MPDDDLVSLTGFETPNYADNDSQEGTAETFNASIYMPAQLDPFGHLHEEMCTLNTKVDQLESNISKKVTGDILSSVPSIVDDTLKANLLSLLLEALKTLFLKCLRIPSNNLFRNPLKRNYQSGAEQSNQKKVIILEGQLTNKDVMAQVKEMKRLADLKDEKEKSKKSL
ncbi:hypothetical protein Tco_0176742 [Tanacetum coccineum]